MRKSAAEVIAELGPGTEPGGIETVLSRSGRPVARRAGRFVDSSHDPEAGALKRLTGLALEGRLMAIVFGDGFGYLSRQLAGRGLEVLLIESDPALIQAGYRALGAEAWASFGLAVCTGEPGPAFWEERVPAHFQASEILLVPPAAGSDALLASAAASLVTFLRRRMVDFQTTLWFGPQWVLNILDNLALLAAAPQRVRAADSLPEGGDWIIAAPGPGLEACLPDIARMRKEHTLLALAPAVRALLAAGILPDLVCTSDGGWANRLHLAGIRLPAVPLVFSLHAAAGIARDWAGPLIPLSCGTALETGLAEGLPCIGETPTVALFALRVALACRAERIILAGQDFASLSCKAHARGYRFEEDLVWRSLRTAPAEKGLARTWQRHDLMRGSWRADSKFLMYRDNLLEFARARQIPLFRIGSSPFLAELPQAGECRGGGRAGQGRQARVSIRHELAADWNARIADWTAVRGTASRPGSFASGSREWSAAASALLADGHLVPLFELGQARSLRRIRLGCDPEPEAGLGHWLARVARRLGILLNTRAMDADR